MRTLFLSLLCLFGALTVLQAQDPGIAYQAVARDADGDPLADAELNVRVTLHGADETTLWQETHASVLTNQFGNLALTFGAGATTPGFGALSSVDWSAAGLHFEIEVDAGAGYASFGDVDVQAVPIAMYALNGQEEEIAALQSQLDILEGDVGQLTSDLAGAIEDIESGDAFLLGLIQANSGAISILQSDVAQNTADLADLMSVITVGPTGITVEDLTVTGDFDITGVFSAATGVFQYLTSNNAEFEDMIAEAAQFEDLTFVAGRGLGPTSTLDIDGTLNVDGNSTMGGNLSVAGTITSGGAEVATLPYVNAADAALAGDIADEAAARIAADGGLQSQISSNANAISALQTADGVLQGNINALGQDVLDNEQASNEADDALELMIQDNASDIVDLQNADVTLQGNINSLQGASEAADSGLQGQISTNAGNISTNAGNISANAGNISANAGAISANAGNIAANASGVSTNASGIASNAAAISTNAGNIATNASGVAANADAIDDNEFRIAATAADMGFGTSTVGSVDNVPQHPGYAGANYLAAGDNLVEADQALDAALKANADADASSTATLSGNIVDLQNADITLQGNINSLQGASEAADTDLQGQISANATAISTNAGNISANAGNIAANAGAISTNAGNIATNASGVSTNASGISTNVSAIAANAAAIDSLGLASVAADGVLQGNIDAEALARANADNAEALARANADSDLQGQITSNDGEIAGLWSGLASEMAARQFGDASNLNMIGANTANLNTEVSNRIAADGALEAYDAYLLNLIENTANTPLDVANIVEGLDYFNASGNVVSLEAPYNALMAGNFIGTTASFDAVDAQDVDVDDAEIQNLVVESNIYSPNGTIDELNVGDLTVYDSSELQGAVTMGSTLVVTDATTLNSTLNVAGETTLGSNVSVQGNVTVSGNVSAADATAAGHLASFGQLTTAADTLQDNIDAEETRALAAEGLLDARADSLAAAVAGNDTDIQTNASNLAQEILDRVADVNAEETRALAAEGLLDARADSLAAAVAGNDTDIQTNANNISSNDTDIQTNANNLAQEILDRVADVNAEETRALTAEGLLDARADSLAAAVAGNDGEISTLQTNLAQEISDRIADVNAEELRATTREDSIIDVLYWNLNGTQLTLDAGISSISLATTNITAQNVEAVNTVSGDFGNFGTIDTQEGYVDYLETNEIDNSGQITTSTLWWTNGRAIGSNSVTDLDGSLNVDGASTMAAITADGLFTLDNNADVNGNADISGTLGVTGTSTLGTVNAGAVSVTSFATSDVTLVDNLNADMLDNQEGTYYTDFTNQVVEANEVTDFMVANNLTVNGGDIDNSSIDGSAIGANTPSTGAFTTATANSFTGGTFSGTNVAASGTLGVTGTSTLGTVNAGAVSVTSFATSSTALVSNLNADMLDGQEGTFYTDFTNQVVDANEVTDLMVANNLTVNGGDIDNSSIDGSVIGANSAAAGTFTSVNASSVTATGAVTGSSLTDGTATLTAGSLTGAVNVTASGTITGGTLTDGTASLTGGSLSSAVNIDGSGDLTMGSITNAEFTVDASGNTDIDGTLDVEGTSNMQSTLTVAGNTDLNADLDVSGNTSLNTGGGSGTVFAVYNSEGAAAVTITTNDDAQAQGGSATTLTTPRLIVQEDAVYNGDMSVGGALAVTSNVTSAAAPSSPNHLTNKGYVDGAIAAAITPPQVFDYEATSSTSGGTIYYLEGDLIVYALEESGQENYEITVYGADLDDVTGAELRLRGNTPLNLYSVNQDWTAASNGLSATFNVGYTALSALAGAQTNGSISCSLVITTATASYNSGVTIRFWLDSSNTAPNGSTFSE